jgi:hypothetical protein
MMLTPGGTGPGRKIEDSILFLIKLTVKYVRAEGWETQIL